MNVIREESEIFNMVELLRDAAMEKTNAGFDEDEIIGNILYGYAEQLEQYLISEEFDEDEVGRWLCGMSSELDDYDI